MKSIKLILVLLFIAASHASSQGTVVHSRGLLHQTVFNTGDLGRPLDGKGGNTGGILGQPSFSWPGNGIGNGLGGYTGYRIGIQGQSYAGFYNAFGGGVWFAADTAVLKAGVKTSPRIYAACGGFSDASGNNIPSQSIPISVKYKSNFPIDSTGNINTSYISTEAEEIITSTWDTPMGIRVTRTSRAWSFPGYDDFIMYDYQLDNTQTGASLAASTAGRPDTLRAMAVSFNYSLGPSLIADMQLNNNNWTEASMRDDKAGALGYVYGRFNWTRYMVYDHAVDGVPRFNGNGQDSILTAPGAVGYFPLYYDCTHLASKYTVICPLFNRAGIEPQSDTNLVWEVNLVKDPTGKTKTLRQPYLLVNDNGNMGADRQTRLMDIEQTRYYKPFCYLDTLNFPKYWWGRGCPNWYGAYRNPTGKYYIFGPYTFLPGERMHFVIAEVAGFGAGQASDRIYNDLGGAGGQQTTEGGSADPQNMTTPYTPGYHPVPSWYDTLQYPYLTDKSFTAMGSPYMKNHPLPDYVDTEAISLHDVADRAIQMYKGGPLIKYDATQFEPSSAVSPSPEAHNYNQGIYIPIPAPALLIKNTVAASNKIIWGPQAESFLYASKPFSYYKVQRANNPIGPWVTLDSVGRRDPRYYKDTTGIGVHNPLALHDSAYIFLDLGSAVGQEYFYSVISVDSTGKKSGRTNLTYHNTAQPAFPKLSKVWAVPNPFVVSSSNTGASASGLAQNKIIFQGLPLHCTIRIFSFSGQLIQTIQHDSDTGLEPWYQVSRNNQWVSSGVYYFVVEDDKGNRQWNKFVIIR
jgi:hypothetical protein